MASTADVVVVGAGVMGSSIAFELAKDGLTVLVVDKAAGPGQGSTSASSAVIRFTFSTWAGVALSWEAKHCWEVWGQHLEGIDPAGMAHFHKVGMVSLDADVAPAAVITPLFDRAGIPYELWGPDELASRVPGLDVGQYSPPRRVDDPAFWTDPQTTLGALWTPDAGFVDDPACAARNLANSAARRGATFRYGRAVTSVLGTEAVEGIELDDGSRVSAPVVVNAAGPWSSKLNQLAGVGGDWSVSVRPLRQEVHHVPAPRGFNTGNALGPAIADLDLGIYMRGTPGDGLLVGGTEPECDPLQWVDDPDGLSPYPTTTVFEAQVTRAARRFPELGVPGHPVGVVGAYDVTEDWTPIYDRTERDGFYVAIGTSGNQFKNAPVVGKLMATLIRGGDTYVGERTGLEIDLAAFSRTRARNSATSGTVMG